MLHPGGPEIQRIMDDREKRHAGRIGAQYAAAKARRREAMLFEKAHFERVPTAFRSDREEQSFVVGDVAQDVAR